MNKGRPTMNDVAKAANVTQATVSYVINESASISDEIKNRVLKAIDEIGYEPNYFARALKTKKSNIIGIIIPDILNEYYIRMINIVEKVLVKMEYTVLINSTNYDKKTEEKIIKQLITMNAEGIIIMYQLANSSCWDILNQAQMAATVLEGGEHCEGINCINIDSHYGSYIATKYLLEQGRRRIAYVGQNSHIETLSDRFQGYRSAMRDWELPYDDLVYHTSGPGDKWKEGIAIGGRVLEKDIDGIVVSSDIIAIGIIKTLLNSDKRIPEDISVIGYDDIPLAELFVPALTTVAQPVEEMCNLAVEKLLQNKDNADDGSIVLLKPELVFRDSA